MLRVVGRDLPDRAAAWAMPLSIAGALLAMASAIGPVEVAANIGLIAYVALSTLLPKRRKARLPAVTSRAASERAGSRALQRVFRRSEMEKASLKRELHLESAGTHDSEK